MFRFSGIVLTTWNLSPDLDTVLVERQSYQYTCKRPYMCTLSRSLKRQARIDCNIHHADYHTLPYEYFNLRTITLCLKDKILTNFAKSGPRVVIIRRCCCLESKWSIEEVFIEVWWVIKYISGERWNIERKGLRRNEINK